MTKTTADAATEELGGAEAETLEELIAADPERPANGTITNRMLRNLRDPEFHDPVTEAARAAARKAKPRRESRE